MSRLNQAVEDRNRPKLQKCLARAKELKSKSEIVLCTRTNNDIQYSRFEIQYMKTNKTLLIFFLNIF
jgi:DNA invertase Pin-like site-specific DNA recombinase